MDFRTCPACKASVLEDDVDECPFCGASMNGKPAAKAPAAKGGAAAKPGAPASKPGAAGSKPSTPEPAKSGPAAKPPAGGPRPPMGAGGRPGGGRGNTVADEENPFDMDMSELQKAIPVSPKETKQRTLEVKCPMCETVGYVAPQHQGKTVKCANPDCKHPYFTVPLPKREAVTTGLKPKSRLTVGHVVAMVAVSIGLIGFVLWKLVYDRASGPTPPVAGNPNDGGFKPPPPPPPPSNDKEKTPEAKRISLAEIQKGSITELERVANTPDSNQSRAIRYLAESYAIAGDVKKVMAELGRLDQKAPDAPYFKVEPLVRLYLTARKKGESDAGKYLDQALAAVEKLPDTGRGPLDAVTALAAALVLDNRMPDAVKLVYRVSVENPAVSVENPAVDYSMLWTAAVYGNAFDFQVLSEIPAWIAAPAPQHQAVTWILSAWGEAEKSLAWAKAAGSEEAVDASLAVWAAHLGQSVASTSEGVQKLEAAIKDAKPAGQSRAWSNFAYQRAMAGDAAGAKELMTKSDAALSLIKKADPVAMPSIRAIYDAAGRPRAGLPPAGPQRSAALAAANLAVLHLKLGDKASVESLIDQGLDFAEAIAPPGPPVAALQKKQSDPRALEYELDQALNLKGKNTFAASTRFRAQVTNLAKEAQKRQQFERELIRDIAYRGEPALAWSIVQKRDALPAERRPMLSETPLAWYIVYTAVALEGKNSAVANSIGPVLKQGTEDKIDKQLQAIVFNLSDDKKLGLAVAELKDLYRAGTYDRDRLDIGLLRRISQYHTLKKSPQKVFDLIRENIPDPQTQEAAMYLMAARSVVEDKAPELFKITSPDRMQRSMKPGERAALARGYVAGVQAAPQAKAVAKGDAAK